MTDDRRFCITKQSILLYFIELSNNYNSGALLSNKD